LEPWLALAVDADNPDMFCRNHYLCFGLALTAHQMNRTIPRSELEVFSQKLAEKRRRLAKAQHTVRGHYDEDGVWQGGLLSFVRYFWHILEPGTPFVDGWALEAVCMHLEAVTFGEITKILINVPPGFMKSLLTDVFWPAWEWGPMELDHIRYVAFSYSSSLTERDNGKFSVLLQSAEYRAMYPHVQTIAIGAKKVSNTKHGWKLATSVGGVGTGERGDRIILDDPHNVKESESELVRQETIRWFRESMSSRLNNMETGAKVVIMQRVNEEDVSGTIIQSMPDYDHLLIRMEYVWDADENGEPYATSLGWVDPRWKPDPEECEGDLAWPERFPERIIPSMKLEAGPFAWACNPYEAPVLMADLSMRPIGTVAVGDKIIGFKVGNDSKRARYQEATILDIHKSLQPCVKITFDSGRTIRCTANHKWWTGRSEAGRQAYASASLGTKLRRVCPPTIEPLSPEMIRSAGWLAWFFDGEGTVSLNQRREHDSASALISFTQSADKNLPICEKLEANLKLLGFDYGMRHRQRTVGHAPVRSYWLKAGPSGRSSMLSLYQRFLHQVQPTKWRDRIIESAVNSRVFTKKERVISIEPDGTEMVYGLTTTTGNYVVWGLASSNSQYQQTPQARGGNLFQLDWWQPIEPFMLNDRFPAFSYVVASLDGAYTEKEENDPSAMTVWGIFENENAYNRACLVHAWRKKLQFSGPRMDVLPGEHESRYILRTRKHWGLVEWVAHTCNRYKVDRLLIEAKATGISAAQSLRNSHPKAGWAIELVEPKGDKVARAIAVQPSFSQFMIYAPEELQWSTMVKDEMAVFPKGRYKDLTDSATQAVKHLRDAGLIKTDEVMRIEELEEVKRHSKPPTKPRYPGFRPRGGQ
jgi:predicted phage terminase large subunit-like protein